MASVALDQVRNKALDLSRHERAALAHDLLASLDGVADEGVEQAWAVEIERRIAALDAGSVQAIEADDVTQRIMQRVRNTR